MGDSEVIALTEVFEILSYMNKVTVMNIPIQILQYIKNNRDTEYVTKVDKNDIFNKDNISIEAQNILAWLDIEYFATDENKKEKLKVYKENEERYKVALKERYDKIATFKTKDIDITEKPAIQIVKYKENIITKFVNFMKKLFKR